MHILRVESRSIDGTAEAVDLGQTPADIVALSFTDADLSVLAAAWEAHADALPSLRLASLARLRHPYSVDLYIEKVLSKARCVLIRLLGGKDYWSYGVDELAMLARSRGIHLAIVPGDNREDARLDAASTLPAALLRQIGMYFSAGGVENIGACLRFVADLTPAEDSPDPRNPSPPVMAAPVMVASPVMAGEGRPPTTPPHATGEVVDGRPTGSSARWQALPVPEFRA